MEKRTQGATAGEPLVAPLRGRRALPGSRRLALQKRTRGGGPPGRRTSPGATVEDRALVYRALLPTAVAAAARRDLLALAPQTVSGKFKQNEQVGHKHPEDGAGPTGPPRGTCVARGRARARPVSSFARGGRGGAADVPSPAAPPAAPTAGPSSRPDPGPQGRDPRLPAAPLRCLPSSDASGSRRVRYLKCLRLNSDSTEQGASGSAQRFDGRDWRGGPAPRGSSRAVSGT